jgi:glycosyltransferase involved in cell wall biosynthesis
MPSYNRAWIIERAINSVLHQTVKDWELIIIDDGSADTTLATVSAIHDRRIVYHPLEKNGGPSLARNKGISMAQGEYIAFLDTDNVFHDNFLEVMSSEVIPPHIMGYCSENMFLLSGEKTNPKIIGRKVRNVEYNPVKLIYTNYIDINSVLVRKHILDEIGGFDEGLRTLEDWDLIVRIALKYPFRILQVDEVLVDYHYFEKSVAWSITNSFTSDQNIRNYFKINSGDGDRWRVIQKINRLLGV